MNAPILYNVVPFDANNTYLFEYYYVGIQQVKVELIVRDARTNEIVYSGLQSSFRLQFTLLGGSLVNGNSYIAELYVYDKDDNRSPSSNKIKFICLTTPLFSIGNLSNNQIIESSVYELSISYYQEDNEFLNYFIITLYNDLGTKIYDSGTLNYSQIQTFQLKELLNNSKYYIDMIGTTVNGMQIKADRIEFSVKYIDSAVFSILDLTEIKESGSVKIRSNIYAIEGKTNADELSYIDSSVDLTEDGAIIYFDDGFQIPNDFGMRIIISPVVLSTFNNKFLIIKDFFDNEIISMSKIIGYLDGYVDELFYVTLSYENEFGFKYFTFSEFIPSTNLINAEKIIINVIKKDEYINIELEVIQ